MIHLDLCKQRLRRHSGCQHNWGLRNNYSKHTATTQTCLPTFSVWWACGSYSSVCSRHEVTFPCYVTNISVPSQSHSSSGLFQPRGGEVLLSCWLPRDPIPQIFQDPRRELTKNNVAVCHKRYSSIRLWTQAVREVIQQPLSCLPLRTTTNRIPVEPVPAR